MFSIKNIEKTIQGRSAGAFLCGLFLTFFCVISEHVVCASDTNHAGHNALYDAQQSMEMMQWEDAYYAAKEYLSHNPESNMRWNAWNVIIDSLLHIEKYDEALATLEDMQCEYAGQHAYEQEIALKKAPLLESLHRYDDAIAVYVMLEKEHYESAPDSPHHLSPEEQGRIQYRLAQLFILDQNFIAAEEKLRICMALQSLPILLRVQSSYNLAQLYAVNGKESEAQELLLQLWSIDSISRSLRARIGFLLADLYERRGKTSQARAMFESLKGIYPNAGVIEMRLKLLE